jgi:hypothetical protein
MNIKFIIEVSASSYSCKHESKYNRIPCFVVKKSKTTNKICHISKHKLWFCNPKYLQFLFFPKLCVLESPYFLEFSPFEPSKSYHYDQNQQEFKIPTNKVPLLVVIRNALFIQNHVFILPP